FNELKEIEENAKFRAARILQFWKEPRKVIFDEKEIKRQDEIIKEMGKLIEDDKGYDERLKDKHYENIQKQIKEELKNVCKENFEENFKNACKLFLEHELQSWHSFCSIDTEHLRFERFEEMNVVTNGYQNKEEEEKKDSFKEATFDEYGGGEIEVSKY
uniref:Uncharacterized protein n=1 Tax=Meloidogyne javanica TaxID=6303 RepID=A0A915LXX9_MELJA